MRQHYSELLARRAQVDERVVEQQVRKPARAKGRVQPTLQSEIEAPQRIDLEDYCLARVAAQPELIGQVMAELERAFLAPLNVEDFDRAENRALFMVLTTSGGEASVPLALEGRWAMLRASTAQAPALPEEQAVKDLVDAILALRIARTRRLLSRLQDLSAEAQVDGDKDAAREYGRLVNKHVQERERLQAIWHQRTMVGKRDRGATEG
jgi:hypothetical protein